MAFILDWILIFFGTLFTWFSYKKICFEKNCSVSNFVICIVFVFCILPIFFNYAIGVPEYKTVYWYKVFISSMNNNNISIIYDLYILFSIIVLQIYSSNYKPKEINMDKFLLFNSKFLKNIIIISPFIYIILSGNLRYYFTYNTQSLRGFDINNSSFFVILMELIFLSLFTYFGNFFRNNSKKKRDYLMFIIYNFFIIWIVGKRFIFANIGITLLYYLSQSKMEDKTRKRMFKFVPMLVLLLVLFSGFYLKEIRPLSDTSSSSIYEMLRVDFGRDDVIKYTIEEELFKNNRILDYRGQTMIGLIVQLVPRKIYPSKPYPHYMYLTSSLLKLPINKLPAGTTPSFYEMSISNFGIFGFIFAIFSLLLFCRIADSSKNIDTKFILLMLIVVLLTQSIDIYIIYIFIILLCYFFNFMYKLRKDL